MAEAGGRRDRAADNYDLDLGQLAKKSRLDGGDATVAVAVAASAFAEEPPEEGLGWIAADDERQASGSAPGNNDPRSEGPESGSSPSAARDGVSVYSGNAAPEEVIPNGIRSWESDEDDKTSHASSSDWTPHARIGPYSFVQQHLMLGTDPRSILKDLLRGNSPPSDLDDMTLWQIVLNILSEPPKRKKRKDINSLEDVVRILKESKKIMILTGAGVSVSCGIPDFRSRDGIYARLAVDFPDLPDPHAMFDIEYFRKDPRPFFKFAKEIYPGQFQPSLCHKFIALLDKQEKLLRNYTQNIDTLEQVAGIRRIVECHGSFAMASCLMCKYKVDCEAIREEVFNQVVPHCPKCPPEIPLAIMKPDIVFFGENLPEQFHRSMKYDKDEVDLLIVIGSSLKVRPVALIPSSIPHHVPQVLINREPLNHLNFDVELLGDCDVVINELFHRLGGEFEELCGNPVKLTEITEKPPRLQKDLKHQQLDIPPTPPVLTEDSSSYEQEVENCKLAASKDFAATSYEPSVESTTSCTKENSEEPEPETIQKKESTSPVAETTGDHGTDANITHPIEESCPDNEHHVPSDIRYAKETFKKGWSIKFPKEQISRRLSDSQYLFLAPNRYIFHGAEVYSDSEGDEGSSSGNSVSDNESCSSRSIGDGEEESDIEEFYNGIEEEAYDADGVYFGGESEHFGSEVLTENSIQGECEDDNLLE